MIYDIPYKLELTIQRRVKADSLEEALQLSKNTFVELGKEKDDNGNVIGIKVTDSHQYISFVGDEQCYGYADEEWEESEEPTEAVNISAYIQISDEEVQTVLDKASSALDDFEKTACEVKIGILEILQNSIFDNVDIHTATKLLEEAYAILQNDISDTQDRLMDILFSDMENSEKCEDIDFIMSTIASTVQKLEAGFKDFAG